MWVAESDDIPGLITEAPTPEDLMRKLDEIIPVLLEENESLDELLDVPVSVMWETVQRIRLSNA